MRKHTSREGMGPRFASRLRRGQGIGRPYTRLGREATNDQEVALQGMINSGSATRGRGGRISEAGRSSEPNINTRGQEKEYSNKKRQMEQGCVYLRVLLGTPWKALRNDKKNQIIDPHNKTQPFLKPSP